LDSIRICFIHPARAREIERPSGVLWRSILTTIQREKTSLFPAQSLVFWVNLPAFHSGIRAGNIDQEFNTFKISGPL
jgi:hypothetical protein